MRAADRAESAGKTGSDAALLIALVFVVGHLREVVIAVWLAVAENVGAGLGLLGGVLSRAVVTDLVVLFALAAVLWPAAGRRRDLGSDFDLACVAFVPYLAVKLVATLVLHVAPVSPGPAQLPVLVIAVAWSAIVLYLAWQQTRRRSRAA